MKVRRETTGRENPFPFALSAPPSPSYPLPPTWKKKKKNESFEPQ